MDRAYSTETLEIGDLVRFFDQLVSLLVFVPFLLFSSSSDHVIRPMIITSIAIPYRTLLLLNGWTGPG